MDYGITIAEALDRLTTEPMVDVWFLSDERPNDPVKANRMTRELCIEMITTHFDQMFESGPLAQHHDMGIYAYVNLTENTDSKGSSLGCGILFLKTRPEKRLSDFELLARE